MAMILSLYGLLCVDVGFSGFRSANGTRGTIFKRRYYGMSVVRALLCAQIAAAVLLPVAWILVVVRGDDAIDAFAEAATCLWMVCLPYAAVIIATLLVRVIPSVDYRSAQSILIFGPLTMLRIPVALAAIAYATARVPDVRILLLLLAGLAGALWCERVLYVHARQAAERERRHAGVATGGSRDPPTASRPHGSRRSAAIW